MGIEAGLYILVGVFVGIASGILGLGGGVLLVPILVELGFTPVHAVATSSVGVLIAASSGTLQNIRTGHVAVQTVLPIGITSVIFAQVGVLIANSIDARSLLMLFGILLIGTIFLMDLRKRMQKRQVNGRSTPERTIIRYVSIGALSGLMAGLFGIGGGVILVPLQVLMLGLPLKSSIPNSLAVIVVTAISSVAGHAYFGNVIWLKGAFLGIGSFIGAQLGVRLLRRLPENTVDVAFRLLLLLLAGRFLWTSLVADGSP